MDMFLLFSVLITLAAVFSLINIRFIKLPSGISLMLMGLVVSIGLISIGKLSPGFTQSIKDSLLALDFSEFILGIVLSFLLFAGSLHVKLDDIKASAKSIFSFATIGTLISTCLIGTLAFFLLPFIGIEAPFLACLLFGALISPTDPIAVIGILGKSNLSKSIETNIVGESLFNDGIGVVVFITLLGISSTGLENMSVSSIGILFAQEAIGGSLVGLAIGYLGFKLMKSIDDFQSEILISLAMVMGGYSLCSAIHVSGPLAMVVAGLFTGNKGKNEAMSDITMDYLGKFWEVLESILNAVLFMLIGLEMVIVHLQFNYLLVGLALAISLVVARYISLVLPTFLFGLHKKFKKGTLIIMSWGGLRGGISIALALSLPTESQREVFVPITFTVVFFSIVVQGLTMGKLIKRIGN